MHVLFADSSLDAPPFMERHSAELTILFLVALVLGALLILVPQLLRSRAQIRQMEHTECLKALEQGQPVPRTGEPSVAAGRTAVLVPMVVIISAATVTCFLVAYRTDNIFAIALATWSVAGIVSLAAITGGVALLGRLANLAGDEDEEAEEKRA